MRVSREQLAVSSNNARKDMIRKVSTLTLGALLFALCSFAQAQQSRKVPRIGFLNASSFSSVAGRVEAFRQGLRELGYMEKENVIVEYRNAEGRQDRLTELADELVRLGVEIIVAGGTASTRTAKGATKTIPIVMTNVSDPVALGFAASLSRPGGNVTGLSTLAPELSGKRLELLKEIIPNLSRVTVIGDSTNPGNAQALKETESAAAAFRVQLQHYLEIRDARDIEAAFRAAARAHADAVLALTSAVLFSERTEVAGLALKNRVPVVYGQPEYVEAGGLMSYGTSISDLYRRAASYVDRILKGANPGELPIEQPTKFELVINLKAAKQIGLTIPPNVLARADRVIR
jgi:putative ABC transport system substrate-binding protein